MPLTQPKLRILHIILTAKATSAPYNEHCLPQADRHAISLCTFFKSEVTFPTNLTVFEGDGTVQGFWRTLGEALTARQYDLIHAHSPHVGMLYLLSRVAGRGVGAASVMTVHDSYPNFKPRNRLLLLPVFAGFTRIICCSWASNASFPALYKRLAGARLGVVQNGMDIGRVDRVMAKIGRRPVVTNGTFTTVAIGRLVDIKNPLCTLEAFRQSADGSSRLVYIGDGVLRDRLQQRAQAAGIAHQAEFTGLIARESVYRHLLNADLFVSTSRGEGLPIAVLEAMACRRPVILSDIEPHREIAAGVDCIPLVDAEDAAGFAREIERMRALSPAARAAIGQQCRRLVEERFSLRAMHSGYAQTYAEISARQPLFGLEQAG